MAKQPNICQTIFHSFSRVVLDFMALMVLGIIKTSFVACPYSDLMKDYPAEEISSSP